MTREKKPRGYLCDGKVQPDIDNDREEQDVESGHHKQGLLQHEHLVERVMHLGREPGRWALTGLHGLINLGAKRSFNQTNNHLGCSAYIPENMVFKPL